MAVSIGKPPAASRLCLAVAAGGALMLCFAGTRCYAENPASTDVPEKMTPFEVTSQSFQLAEPDEADRAHMSSYDVFTTAGTNGDVNRAIQLIPGVPSVDEGTAIFVKGGDSSETTYYVDDVPFPSTHQELAPVGTFQQTLRPSYLRKIDFYNGNTPVKFDNVLSGAVNMQTIRATPDFEGTLDVGLSTLFALEEVPIAKGAGIAVGGALTNTAPLYLVNSTPLKYTVKPKGKEAFANGSFEKKQFIVEGVFYAQTDQVGLVANSDNFTGVYSQKTSTVFAAVRAKGVLGLWDWKFVAGGGIQTSRETLGVLDFNNNERTGFASLELTRDLANSLTFGFGSDFAPDRGKLHGTVPATAALNPGAPELPLDFVGKTSSTGLFTSLNWHPLRKLEIVPGIRLEKFGDPNRMRAEPRLSIDAPVKKGVSAQLFAGRISKGPPGSQLDSAPQPLSITDLNEVSASFSVTRRKWSYSVGAFHKQYFGIDQFNSSHIAEGFGHGSARGVWFGASLTVTKAIRLTGSYTLAHSERTDPENYSLVGASNFDVRNTAALHADYLFKQYTFSLLGKTASGKPYTPVDHATFFPDGSFYLPQYGAFHGSRLPATYRMDASFSRFDVIGKVPVVTYLSINNLTNHNNVFGYAYSADYTTRQSTGRLFPRTIYFGTTIKY